MPSVDVSSLITGLNPIRQTSSYTMPVLSPRHSSTSTLAGSYRSTFSSSSIDRPYYGSTSYITPRITTYTERFTSRSSYTSDDTKKLFARHTSITEDGLTSRYRDDSREKSSRRDSLTRDSGYRDGSTRSGSLRDASLTRMDARERTTPLTMIDTVADLRSKYSPANYVPAVLRRHEIISRSKSINDIGKPPIERTDAKSIVRTKKVNDSGVPNGLALTNTTNCNDNIAANDDNGNKKTVAEIRKKFDPIYNRKVTPATNGVYVDGAHTHKHTEPKHKPLKSTEPDVKVTLTNKPNFTNDLNHDANVPNGDRDPTTTANGVKLYNRPAKCFKINDLDVIDTSKLTHKYLGRTLCGNNSDKIVDNSNSIIQEMEENSSMDTTEENRTHNHTTNFASYIPSKEYNNQCDATGEESEKVTENKSTDGGSPMNEGEDMNFEHNDATNTYTQQRALANNTDITTSPRLNRTQLTQNASGSTQNHTANNLTSIGTTQRSSPIIDRNRDDDRNFDRSFGLNSVNSQGLNGLKNIGNTCFMNSVIQCLSNTRYLLEYVRNDIYLEDINTSISPMKGALIKAFSQVIQELWSPDSCDRVVNTVSLKSQIQRFAPRFMGYAQQDAQEFLRYLLEGLHEDVNRVTVKPTPILTEIDEKLSDSQKATESWQRYLRMDNSRVVDIFVGQLKSTLRCTYCGHCSVTFDPFWDLSLPIPQRQGSLRLSQCLEHFTREETLDGDEKPTCSKCKERRKCTKSFSIQKFPKILVIHLKRFSPTERFRGKLSLVIDFPLQGLDMSPFAATAGSRNECTYNLYAVSNHSGTTYSGHYTAYCKHPYSGHWHEYNDSRVSSISPKNVVSSEAYVLFYELAGQQSHL